MKSVSELRTLPKNSIEIIFCKSNTEFDKIVRNRKYKISSLQRRNFKSDKNSEIDIWSAVSPELTLIKKAEVDEKFNVDFFRNYLSGVIQSLDNKKFSTVVVRPPNFADYKKYFNNIEYFYQTAVEGLLLGNYNFKLYKSEKKKIEV